MLVHEAAARASRSAETVRRWIRSGLLRAHKVGTQHVIDERDLDEVLATASELPTAWGVTATGEPMPDVVEAVRRSRVGR